MSANNKGLNTKNDCFPGLTPKFKAARFQKVSEKIEDDHITVASEESSVSLWEAHYSEEHQREYYYNPVDSTVSWYAPNVSLQQQHSDSTIETTFEDEDDDHSVLADELSKPIVTSSSSLLCSAKFQRRLVTVSAMAALVVALQSKKIEWVPYPKPRRRTQRARTYAPFQQAPSEPPAFAPPAPKPVTAGMNATEANRVMCLSWELNADTPVQMPTAEFTSLDNYLETAAAPSKKRIAPSAKESKQKKVRLMNNEQATDLVVSQSTALRAAWEDLE